jgi:hypothetical protein
VTEVTGGTPTQPEPAPRVSADPTLRTGAGTPVQARIMITNRAHRPRVMALTAMGVDAGWLPRPGRSRVVAPGETIIAELTLSPAIGTLPARYPVAVAIQALDPATEQATSPTVLAEIQLIVDAPGQIDIGLSPNDTTAVFGKRISIELHNSGAAPVSVRLDVHATSSIPVHLEQTELNLQAGEARRVRGRVHVKRVRLFGHRARHTYSVTARSSAAPRHVEGSVTARALLGPGGTKFAVLATLIAVWVALAIVFIPKLADSIKNKHTITAESVQTGSAAPSGGASASGAPASGGSASGSGSGAGGSGASASGSGSSGGAAGNGTAAVQLSGTINGSAPGGVTVGITPTSLADQAVQGATGVGVDSQSLDVLGKVPATALLTTAPSTVSENRSTTTGKDGAWTFAGVRAPGYYLLTFAKPGYQTERYVVNAASAAAGKPLEVTLVPGQGRLTGTVRGPDGPVGGAKITITDGTNTLTTSSNTKGQVGAWSVDGLSTPSSYLVSASKDGLGTESSLVNLAAGGSSSLTLRLKTGVASLVGEVQATNSLGAFGGLGGATVTVTNGTITRTATTITTRPVGFYTLPDLPVPGKFSVTISADGYLPQTQTVSLKKGQSKARVGAVLTSASATVTGKVIGDDLDQNGNSTGTSVKVDAGLKLTSQQASYKITTTSDGQFHFTGVAAGTYVLSAEYANLQSQYRTITVHPGDSIRVPTFNLKRAAAVNTSTITGFVASATSPSGAVICSASPNCTTILTFSLYRDDPKQLLTISLGGGKASTGPSAPASANGPTGYTISTPNGLTPGLYHLSISADGYLTGTVRVQVPLNNVATAPEVSLFPANTIGGTLSALGSLTGTLSAQQVPQYVNCVWAVPQAQGATPPTTCPTVNDDRVHPVAQDTSACKDRGQPAADFALLDTGTNEYRIDNLCDGTYNVYVVITNPDYVTPAPTAVETVTHGQTLNYSPHVFRKARVDLTFYTDHDGTLVRAGADAISARAGVVQCTSGDGTQSAKVPFSSANSKTGQLIVSGLDEGTVTCEAYDGNAKKLGQTSGIGVSKDADTPADMVLAASLDPAIGTIVSNYVTPGHATTAVAGVGLTITGTTGYDGTAATTGTANLTTGPDGCFAVTADGSVPSDDHCTGLAAGSSVKALDLYSSSVTIQITSVPSGYEAPNPATISGQVAGGHFPAITLIPVPSPTTVALTTSDGSIPTGATITVDQSGAPNSGSISARVGSNGQLVWHDSNYDRVGGSPNGAWPGTYQLTAKLAGYEDASTTMTCAFNTACTLGGAFQLVHLGALSGTVYGYLGSTTTDPHSPLVAATITATYCDQKTANSTTCDTTGSTVSATTLTGVDGRYTITGTPGQVGLPLGWWKVSFAAGGYTGDSTIVQVGSNGPTTADKNLFAILKKISIGAVKTVPMPANPTKDDLATDAIITMTRLDTYTATTEDSADPETGLYVFENSAPTIYQISIVRAGQPTITDFVSIPSAQSASDTSQTIYLSAGVSQNTVLGVVMGASGANTTASGLNGVTVDLGTYVNGTYTVSADTAGNAMTIKTQPSAGTDGVFSFSSVPNGTYYARYRYLDTSGNPTGYVPQLSATQITAFGGIPVSLAPVTLARVTHQVVVGITATSDADDLSGTTVSLTADPVDSSPPQSPHTAGSGSGHKITAGFPQVTYGTWDLKIVFPAGHYGTLSALSGSPSLTCTIDDDSSQMTCAGTLTLSSDPDDNGDTVNADYQLDEQDLQLRLAAAATATDSSGTLDSVPDMQLTVAGGSTTYPTIPVTGADLAAGTVSTDVWLPAPPSKGYSVAAAPKPDPSKPDLATAWPSVSLASNIKTLSTSDRTKAPVLTITEQPILVLAVAGATTANPASVSIVDSSGDAPPGYATATSTDGSANLTFYLPAGSWTVTATIGAKNAVATVQLVAGKSGDNGDGDVRTLTPKLASITVTVTKSDGTAIDGAALTFTPKDGQAVPTDAKDVTTGSAGTSTVSDLPVGDWTITATTGSGKTQLSATTPTITLVGGANDGVTLVPK